MPISLNAVFNTPTMGEKERKAARGQATVDRISEIVRSEIPEGEVIARISGEAFVTLPGELSDLVSGAIEKVIGIRPDLSTTGGTSDARFLTQFCPVVEIGLCYATLHKLDEAAALDDIRELTKIYVEIIARASE